MRLDRLLATVLVTSAVVLLGAATVAGAQTDPDITDGTSVNYVPPSSSPELSAVPTVPTGPSLTLGLFAATLRSPAALGPASIAFTAWWPWISHLSPAAVREPAAVGIRRPDSWISRVATR